MATARGLTKVKGLGRFQSSGRVTAPPHRAVQEDGLRLAGRRPSGSR